MTYRERQERKAERLRGWAEGREAKADAARAGVDQIAGMIPFGQPILVGHHSERRHRRDIDRIDRGMRATVEHGAKAQEMAQRADNIEAAAAQAIYSDDPDATERLAEKIAKLEARRDRMKAANAEFRKAHREELKGRTAYERSCAMPHASYELTNLGANIRRLKGRLEEVGRPPRDRVIEARFGGACEDCGAAIEKGDLIRYSRAAGARCAEPCGGGA